MILTKAKTKIGRRDHGRKMSLKAFEFVETEEGWLRSECLRRDLILEVRNDDPDQSENEDRPTRSRAQDVAQGVRVCRDRGRLALRAGQGVCCRVRRA